jgi:hypothetical protein
MKKRIPVALLWFYATWLAWAVLAHFVSMSELAGPVLGAAVAALVAGDPFHRIWARVAERAQAAGPTAPAGARQVA